MTPFADADDFDRQVDCTYKGERYSVRDNGAVLRHSREGGRKRPADDQWTFGKPNKKTGYMEIASVRVHRIVVTAFHGEPPTPEHVVDHIDRNRHNNRPENLRWVTRLENALKNPLTRKYIELTCGVSIETFLADPSKFRDKFQEPNFKWMQTVSAEESKACLERITMWANSEEMSSMERVPWEYIYFGKMSFSRDLLSSDEQMSKTQNAAQRNWFIPSEFPCCPERTGKNPIATYAENLKSGAIFYRNEKSCATILDFVISDEGQSLYVMLKKDTGRPWALAKITYREGPYVYMHEIIGTFLSKEDAEKQFTVIQAREQPAGGSGDDSVD
ncbi:MAG: HNH endonuclease [Treponematales bacterium]